MQQRQNGKQNKEVTEKTGDTKADVSSTQKASSDIKQLNNNFETLYPLSLSGTLPEGFKAFFF